MAETNNGIIVINVLDDTYFDDCRIANSINLPLRDIEKCDKDFDKDAEIVVYCAHELCTAGAEAFEALKEMGFTNVRIFQAGMAGWYQSDLPVEGSCTREYLAHQPTREEKLTQDIISAEELAKKMGFR